MRSLLASKATFVKTPRAEGDIGKGNYWGLETSWSELYPKDVLFFHKGGRATTMRTKRDKQQPPSTSSSSPVFASVENLTPSSYQQQQHGHDDGGHLALLTASLDEAHRESEKKAAPLPDSAFPTVAAEGQGEAATGTEIGNEEDFDQLDEFEGAQS